MDFHQVCPSHASSRCPDELNIRQNQNDIPEPEMDAQLYHALMLSRVEDARIADEKRRLANVNGGEDEDSQLERSVSVLLSCSLLCLA